MKINIVIYALSYPLYQVIDCNIFEASNINIRSGTGVNPTKRTPHSNKILQNQSATSENSHIAFGSRVRSGKNHTALNNSKNHEESINYTDRSNILAQRNDNKNGSSKHKTKGLEQHAETSLTSRGLSILPSKPSSTSSSNKDINNNIYTNINVIAGEIDPSSDAKKIEFQPRPPPKKDLNKKKTVARRRIVKSADIRSRVQSSPRGEDVNGDGFKKTQRQKQVFSKSADSRNRRRPSLLSENSGDELPDITKINKSTITRKGISRSAFDLEKTEKIISDNRDLHFKSKSLSVLPKIGGATSMILPTKRNDRYGKSVTSSQNNDNVNDNEPSQSNFTDDNVFVTATTVKNNGDDNMEDPDVSSEELLALADENEVEDYLKLRTRSSCREDDTTSSCNSANSDLYMYSSRPRSVIRQRANSSRSRQPSETEKQQRSSRSSSRNALAATDTASNNNNNNTEELSTDSTRPLSLKLSRKSLKQNICKVSSEIDARERTSIAHESGKKESSMLGNDSNNNNNETFTISSSYNMLSESQDFNNNINNGGGLDLSWEYSESTSMLILPEELKMKNKKDENELSHNTPINIRYGAKDNFARKNDIKHNSLDNKDEGFSGHHDNEEQTALSSDVIIKTDSEVTVGDTTSSGVVSDASSNEDMIRNDELSSRAMNQQTKPNNTKLNNNLSPLVNRKQPVAINSSYIMRESCDSDSMSWLQASTQDFDENNNDNVEVTNHQQHTPPTFNDKLKKSPSMALKQRLKEQLGSLLMQSTTGGDGDNDNEDGMSECSDDTTFTDMPPKKFKNYRYAFLLSYI